ncbi:chromate efflux transporter [Nocardia tengchongensis]|uniref:Chromate efflux transporter n=1 Tax=Nocardia tengchongensis TaxID=2055889 RepID=A0ABX8CUQ2_9NOCA|nr:chromate efflux transporter [Nocardia tengchongensis]QVI23629.1 chromate efflux transporter [Nocardia tengchongensis]
MSGDAGQAGVRLTTIAREWGRIGCIGFGGPPTHIALLRRLCVEERKWLAPTEFEDAIAATNLLPGPASTQLAIYSAWRLRGTAGALVGGVCFIVPGLVVILGLAAFFLSGGVPRWALGAAAGAGAAVAAVAVHAGVGLAPASWQRAGTARAARLRWIGYLLAGGLAAALTGPWLVLVLVATGVLEVVVRTGIPGRSTSVSTPLPLAITVPALGGLAAVSWVAFKVGALSYGGGFVIIPLMQSDAVTHYHWMTDAQFLNAVALGQITPGPVVQTVAAVGYAAAGLPGGLLAALVAFAPSFLFILCGGPHFDRLRTNPRVLAFLSGSGPAVIGAILGSAIPLTLALQHAWQFAVLAAAALWLAAAALWLVAARRGVVGTLLSAAAIGVAAAALGLPIT